MKLFLTITPLLIAVSWAFYNLFFLISKFTEKAQAN